MITGLKRSSGTGDSRLPITRQMLQQIVRVFSCVCTSQFEVKLFTAAFALIFHGLFRVGELTVDNRYAHHTVQHSNVKVFDKYVEIYLPTSKTDQFRKGYTIQICKHEDSTVCPVSTLGSYLGFRPNFQGPLFCHFDGKSLSSYQYTAVLKKTLALLGHDTANYKSHSFRIGMATTVTLEGFTDDQIKAMGRWKSDCCDGAFEYLSKE